MTEDAVKTEVNDEVLESELILLSATVYANNLSFIRFWIGGEEYSAWTDIDTPIYHRGMLQCEQKDRHRGSDGNRT